MTRLNVVPFLVVAACLAPAAARSAAHGRDGAVWVQDSFEDFRAGAFEDGGANLYVTRGGQIRSIYTFDYNRDGANDVLFVCGHNVNDAPPTYLYMNGGGGGGGAGGLDPRHRWALRNDGAHSGLVADLNADGWPDVVLCGTTNGMATRAPLDSYVYYGSDKGFFPANAARLPTFGAASVAAGDFNSDGRDDLVFSQSGRPVVAYWNSPNGFDAARRVELPVTASFVTAADVAGDERIELVALRAGAVEVYRANGNGIDSDPTVRLPVVSASRCAVADLDGDGRRDIVVAAAGKTPQSMSSIFWNDGGQFTKRSPTTLPTSNASGCAVGDLDGDGLPDIAFANAIGKDGLDGAINSVVYFGSKDGFDPGQKREYPTRWASACAIGDVDGDGHADLAFANRTSLHTLDTTSFLYRGGPGGPDPAKAIELPGHGAKDVLIADVNADRRNDLVLFNAAAGFNGERFLRLYWNDGAGGFARERKTDVPSFDSFSAVCADLNDDGHLDWAVPNSYEYSIQGEGTDRGSFIYWGDASGTWDQKRLTRLPTRGASGVVTADLDRDGYLDLVLPQFTDPGKRQLVFWGGKDGYSGDRTTALHMPQPRGVTLADLDKDGFLEIVIADLEACEAAVFRGGADGYSDARKIALPAGAAVSVNAADLNNDDWLDLLVVNFYDGKKRIENTHSMIYWGGPDGFDRDRRALLPSVGGDQATIADFNRDGRLDIAVGNYATGARDRTWFSYVYWNAEEGFDPARRTDLLTDGGSGNVALDLNRDGWLELVMACHKQSDGNHSTDSLIFWGGPDGFDNARTLALPTDGAHETTFMDAGNIYTRRPELHYRSAIHERPSPQRLAHVERDAQETLGSKLTLEFRSAETRADIDRGGWTSDVKAVPAGRFWQYRATFRSADGSNYPVLDAVRLTFESAGEQAR